MAPLSHFAAPFLMVLCSGNARFIVGEPVALRGVIVDGQGGVPHLEGSVEASWQSRGEALSLLQLDARRSMGGLPSANLKQICQQSKCAQDGGINNRQTCEAIFWCRQCQMSSVTRDVPLEQHCMKMGPPSTDSLILGVGVIPTDQLLKGGKKHEREATHAEVQWDNQSAEFTLKNCELEDFPMHRLGDLIKDLQSDLTKQFGFHHRLVLDVTFAKVGNPRSENDLEFQVIYHPPGKGDPYMEKLYKTQKMCRQNNTKFTFGKSKAPRLKDGETAHIVKSFSVPFDITTVNADDFELRISCAPGGNNCNLANYRICVRALCRAMPAEQQQGLFLLQEAVVNRSNAGSDAAAQSQSSEGDAAAQSQTPLPSLTSHGGTPPSQYPTAPPQYAPPQSPYPLVQPSQYPAVSQYPAAQYQYYPQPHQYSYPTSGWYQPAAAQASHQAIQPHRA